jgi:aspartate/glutamate racemase
MPFHRVRDTVQGHGHTIGVITLDDEAVPFIPGSVGNASTYDYPVLFHCVPGLRFADVFAGNPACGPLLVEAARHLEAQGVRGITGNCGFMVHFQRLVAGAVGVPVFLSSLMQLPMIAASIGGGRRIGIIAADEDGITPAVLASTGLHEDVPVAVRSMKDKPEFHRFLVEMRGTLDDERLRGEVVEVAAELAAEGGIGAILLECSELPPYAFAVQQATGLPTYDFITMIDYFHAALNRRAFSGVY